MEREEECIYEASSTYIHTYIVDLHEHLRLDFSVSLPPMKKTDRQMACRIKFQLTHFS